MINLQEEVHDRAKRLAALHRKYIDIDCRFFGCRYFGCVMYNISFYVAYYDNGDNLYIESLCRSTRYMSCFNIGDSSFGYSLNPDFDYNRILPVMDQLIKYMEETYEVTCDNKTVTIDGKEYILKLKEE